ncbi:MAG: DinB family protein [Nocardioides sp.]|nr:DinB family protein [Nocardioides sp.]
MTGFQGSGFFDNPATDPRLQTPNASGEKAVLTDYLEFYRRTFEMKCDGLTPEQLATRSVPPSTLSLLGLLRHLGRVEHAWFRRVLDAHLEVDKLYHHTDGDVAFDAAEGTEECVAQAWSTWRREVDFARAWLNDCDDLDRVVTWGEESAEVRDLVVHMIEEYARHCGHADLLRECIDGRTGQ